VTSIAVHPTRPHIFCTTSRDNSARIYDLTLTPMEQPNNPHWPPGTQPSLAGAAHGLHMNEREGSGLGRCIIVLMGGRSGGHQAAVLGAVCYYFHVRATLSHDVLGVSSSISYYRNMWGEQAVRVLGLCCSSFSPQLDRCVKIWAIRPVTSEQITREDKPLFSTGRIHKSRVLSISW
jgi:polycomb protein EED